MGSFEFVVHIAHIGMYIQATENFTVYKWVKKIQQISYDGSVPVISRYMRDSNAILNTR